MSDPKKDDYCPCSATWGFDDGCPVHGIGGTRRKELREKAEKEKSK